MSDTNPKDIADRIHRTYCHTRMQHRPTEDPEDLVPISSSLLEYTTRSLAVEPTETLRQQVDAAFRAEYL